ncbi:MAG: UDP-2,4-diacetamido-2,4,6-trideoxy-beta-L-altropyranose hydrolase [Steroidobacteraceae bacterium]
MRVAFRADASVALGTGHIRRCLALAAELALRETSILFVCRALPGHMMTEIVGRGFAAAQLEEGATAASLPPDLDAQAMAAAVIDWGSEIDWIVVDHYGLDLRWERLMRGQAARVMVIDDRGDRPHDCDLLLDQNFPNPVQARYSSLIPPDARQLLGTQYALLAPEFSKMRAGALARRSGTMDRLLVSMGGTDPANETAKVLDGFARSSHADMSVDVVLGAANPHRSLVQSLCDTLPGCRMHVETRRMAELMCAADLAIGGGGSTTWERCTLGLPAIAVTLSDDQEPIARAVAEAGGQRLLGSASEVEPADYTQALDELKGTVLKEMADNAARLCDGRGAARVATIMTSAA